MDSESARDAGTGRRPQQMVWSFSGAGVSRFTYGSHTIRLILSRLLMGAALFIIPAATLMAEETAKVAIIIDDLGNNLDQGETLIDLPYPLTYSFLPRRPYSRRLAHRAAAHGKEVMVHLPMQSADQLNLGLGALTLELTQKQFQTSVRASMASIPHARGVNNHMGSLLTQHPGHMAWLMQVLASMDRVVYFVDSKTTPRTIAAQIAHEYFIPNISRDVFIDRSRREQDLKQQLEYLIKVAKRNGYAVAIGHPYPATIKVLSECLPSLIENNIEIVPVTALIDLRMSKQAGPALMSR